MEDTFHLQSQETRAGENRIHEDQLPSQPKDHLLPQEHHSESPSSFNQLNRQKVSTEYKSALHRVFEDYI
jgi:hypothetical protein